MEHSWIGNDTMGAVMKLLSKGGRWEGDALAWVGDYSEGRFANIYGRMKVIPSPKPMGKEEQQKCIVVNHSSKEYFILSKTPKERDGWQINALSLLTATSNGMGGGDYRGINDDQCGIWAGDKISISKTIPRSSSGIPYKEFFVKWVEDEDDGKVAPGYYVLYSQRKKYDFSHNGMIIFSSDSVKAFDKFLKDNRLEDFINKKRKLRAGVQIK